MTGNYGLSFWLKLPEAGLTPDAIPLSSPVCPLPVAFAWQGAIYDVRVRTLNRRLVFSAYDLCSCQVR
jgi:hypothetical protein